MNTPLCAGKWELFDSRDLGDHQQAAKLCAACPLIKECAGWLDDAQRNSPSWAGALARPSGTWAGMLVGSVAHDAQRLLTEEGMFSDEEARAAHAAWRRGKRDDRTRIGERVYQRRSARGEYRRPTLEDVA